MNHYMFFSLLAYSSGAYGMGFGIYKALQKHIMDNKVHNNEKPVLEDVCNERVKRMEETFKTIKEDIASIKSDIKIIAKKNETS